MAEEEVKIIVKKTNKHSPQHPVLANKSWRVPAYKIWNEERCIYRNPKNDNVLNFVVFIFVLLMNPCSSISCRILHPQKARSLYTMQNCTDWPC